MEAVQNGTSVRITPMQIAALSGQSIISSGYVTQNQFFLALPLMTPALDPNLLYQAIPPDFSNGATVQFYTSPYVRDGSPIANLAQTTYGLNAGQMATLFAIAAAQALWG